jgi:hypothetical protein
LYHADLLNLEALAVKQWINGSRLSFPTAAILSLAATVLALDTGLAAVFGANPRWMPATLRWYNLADFGARVAGFEQMRRAGRVENDRLVALLGMSTVRGLNPRILSAADPRGRTWMMMGAVGNSFGELDHYVQPLLDSSLRPSLVVLAVHESMLHGKTIQPEDLIGADFEPALFTSHLRRHELRHAAMDVSWLLRNQTGMEAAINLVLYRQTKTLRATFDLPMSATFPTERDPLASWGYYSDLRAPQDYLDRQLIGYSGRLDPGEYVNCDREIAAFCDLVHQFRAQGARVVCVLMPESSTLRGLHTPIVQQRFDEALAKIAAAGGPLEVFNLRTTMPDSDFYDYGHLNPPACARFSAALPLIVR